MVSLNLFFTDIKGEVENPGVYSFNSANIQDIINFAGGLTKNADTSNINLSKSVNDEMVIYIPNRNDKYKKKPVCKCPTPKCQDKNISTSTTKPVLTTITTSTTRPLGKININTATVNELRTLHGIGEVIANRIIAYREITPFMVIEDLLKVPGIGESIFAQIKDFITV